MPAPLRTTTIGSLPRFAEDIEDALVNAIEFQQSMGLDLLTDGEQRSDMVSYFAESFQGLDVKNGLPVVSGEIRLRGRPEEFSKVKDLDTILRRFPDTTVKIALTGPTTLGMTCASRKIESHYRGLLDFTLYEDIASALIPIAESLIDRGAHVQIDEPFLSQGFKDLPARVALIDRIAEGLPRNHVSLHVCGYIGRFDIVNHLLGLENVSTLSFAFSGQTEKRNIEHIDQKSFEDHTMTLGAGCISVTPLSEKEIDSTDMVKTKLGQIADRIGWENIEYIHPDCGLRATKKDLVPIILKNMRAGAELSH